MANFGGRLWAALLNVACIPIYVDVLGVESYGLIGFYATLQASLLIFDFGLSTTLVREMARLSTEAASAANARNTVRTLEIVYWVVGVAIALAVAMLSAPIAHYWVHANALSPERIQRVVAYMGITAALQWPVTLYTGGLLGLQRQVLSNVVNGAMLTVRFVGAAIAISWVDSSIESFFVSQVASVGLHVLVVAMILWRVLPKADCRATFQPAILRHLWRFAAGMSGATVATLAFVQIDKVFLSSWLTLREFGFYNLAATLGAVLFIFYNPVGTAFFPPLSRFVATGRHDALQATYRTACRLVTLPAVPTALVMSVFAPETVFLWTRNATTTAHVAPLVSLVMLGALLGALTYIPILTQWAYGWTSLTWRAHACAAIALVPAVLVSTAYLGPLGAMLAWVVIRLGLSLFIMERMYSRLLRAERIAWYRDAVFRPVAACAITLIPARVMIDRPSSAAMSGVVLAGMWVLAVLSCSLATPALLQTLRSLLHPTDMTAPSDYA